MEDNEEVTGTEEESPEIEESSEESQEPSLRDTLETAMEEVDATDEGNDTSEPEKSTEGADTEPISGESEGNPDDEQIADSYKAPQSWKPAEREQWSKIPKELQHRIKAREAETDALLRETSEARNTHQFISQLEQSYAPILAAEGVRDTKTAIKGLFDSVSLLRNGSPQDKALKMAQFIQHYGVDIEALDSALVGERPQASPNAEIEHLIEQRLQPVNQLLERVNSTEQRQRQAVQESANQEVANFKGEFLSDVRNDMPDIIDMAASRGQDMTLQKAYDIAVNLRPDLSEIINKRKQEEAITGKRNHIGKKLNAASSVAGSRGGMAGGAGGGSLRDEIEAAWNEAAS